MRIKSAITLTVAFSFLLSGVYFAWLSPLNEYSNTQEIARSSSLLKPQETSQLSFDVESEKKISYNIDASFQTYDQSSPFFPPTFSIKVFNPSGEIIRVHENVANVYSPQAITTKDSGTYKMEITNISNSTFSAWINAYVQEIKPPNPTRHLEPVGHWFIFMALPIIGLGIWFAIVKVEPKHNGNPV